MVRKSPQVPPSEAWATAAVPQAGPDETLDSIFGGRIRVLQSTLDFRFNLDSVLLGHFASESKGRVIDLGTGSGIIPLIIWARGVSDELVGIEIQEQMCAIARRSGIPLPSRNQSQRAEQPDRPRRKDHHCHGVRAFGYPSLPVRSQKGVQLYLDPRTHSSAKNAGRDRGRLHRIRIRFSLL
jgi:hypothetical protein